MTSLKVSEQYYSTELCKKHFLIRMDIHRCIEDDTQQAQFFKAICLTLICFILGKLLKTFLQRSKLSGRTTSKTPFTKQKVVSLHGEICKEHEFYHIHHPVYLQADART